MIKITAELGKAIEQTESKQATKSNYLWNG